MTWGCGTNLVLFQKLEQSENMHLTISGPVVVMMFIWKQNHG